MLTHEADEDYERGAEMIKPGCIVELAAVVVIPARDEEDQIAGCLEALGGADRRAGELRDDRRARRMHRRNRPGRETMPPEHWGSS